MTKRKPRQKAKPRRYPASRKQVAAWLKFIKEAVA